MKEFEPRTCEVCGQPYLPVRSTQKYCSDKCYNTAASIRKGHKRATPLEPRTCEACGQPFLPKQSNQTVCSPKCRRWLDSHNRVRNRRNPSVVRTCVICGKTFETNKQNKRACSPACSKILRHPKAECREVVCVFCGKRFTTHKPNAKCCSQICADRHRRGWASLAEYTKAQEERKARGQARRERRTGISTEGLTLAEMREVDLAQDGDKSLLWKRSQSWTKRQRKYARQRYEKNHGLFTSTFNP